MERLKIVVEGQVQGVGFRPFVHGLALRLGLGGWVRNGPPGVVIEVEGPRTAVAAFREELLASPPPGSILDRVDESPLPPNGAQGFQVRESQEGAGPPAIAPDLATCAACLRELRDPGDRRARYPFLACAHCGPRYTVVRSAPYDRHRTTLEGFSLCPPCLREYEDPGDRRFHAQALACPECGPMLRAHGAQESEGVTGDSALEAAVVALKEGRIVAVKGLGGFHLACDATRREAVTRLRARKGRDAKPLAVMVRDLEAARALCRVGPREESLLASSRAPIVILPRRPEAAVASNVAPGLKRLGLILPYTPLHHLLLDALDGPLVLTSGNRSGEVLAHRDEDARTRLGPVADLFLTHNRPIHVPCDDSVLQAGPRGPVLLRRSRGYVPESIRLPRPVPQPLLALGGHLKNTFAVARGDRVALSQHLGDLDDLSTAEAFCRTVTHLCSLAGVAPELLVHDMHPDYRTTRLAEEWRQSHQLGGLAVQHHHAHALSCLAEHRRLETAAAAVVFDGSGYGSDGTVWGGEFLLVGPGGWRRQGHLAPRPLPGGEAAVREPWRMALAHLEAGLGGTEEVWTREPFRSVEPPRRRAVLELLRGEAGTSATSSVGRLFDAVAALVGLRGVSHYEGHAAMELEAASDARVERSYPIRLRERENGGWTWDPAPLMEGVLSDLRRGRATREIGGAFHNAVRDAIVAGCRRLRDEAGIDAVALTGGIFQNALLVEKTVLALRGAGFTPLLHGRVPPNDGGLSLGQSVAPLVDVTERPPLDRAG